VSSAGNCSQAGRGPEDRNFNKFLIGRDGAIVGRFGGRTKPDDKALVEAVEQALQTKD